MNRWYLNILRPYIFYQYVSLSRFRVYSNILYDIHKSKILQYEYLTPISDLKNKSTCSHVFQKNVYPNKYKIHKKKEQNVATFSIRAKSFKYTEKSIF